MPLDPDMKEGLDGLLEAAQEAGPEWAEDVLGYVEEELHAAADEDMKKEGVSDEDERDAVKAVVTVKALYLAYREALTDISDPDARAYVQAAVERAGAVSLGTPVAPQPPRGVVAPIAPPAPLRPVPSPRPPVPPGPSGFKPPKIA